ncbi:MAG TPA: class I adenylate-forming enzyme family protein [Solirubrobacteraceae bacterium]|jgi:acyl-CoA synthetase (AMP-forming)/AMP-acid ligase II|nr:class I adenylate-forming enzyme family protein [Solirubrobacteraceae bacterium]
MPPTLRTLHPPERRRHFGELGLWGERTIAELVAAQAERRPDHLAVADAHVRLRYGELWESTGRLAALLRDRGVAPGDPVAAQLPSCALLPLVHLACNRLGALFVPMSTSWREREVGGLLAAVEARVLIAAAADGDFDLAAMHAALGVRDPLYVRQPGGLEEAIAAQAPIVDVRPGADEPAHVMVSSGTTGVPKASVWSSNDVIAMLAHYTREALEIDERDVAGGLAPANLGSTGYVFPVLTPLLLGASSVLLERWSPAAALELLARERCTYATAVPTQMVMLLDEPLHEHDLGALTRFNNAGAPLSPDVAQRVEERIGCRVQTIYGATDGGVPVMTSIADPDGPRRSSVGRVCRGQELALRGAAAPGEPGEVCWRGPTKSFGYLGQPDYDEAAFDAEGWFRSGDLGVLDGQGYLRIVGRSKDMILRGGTNIFPAETEALLAEHPAVRAAAVVGVPDARLGELVCAVIAGERDPPGLAALCAFLAERGLARFKHPERLLVVAELPLNAGGKLDRAAVRELALVAPSTPTGAGAAHG